MNFEGKLVGKNLKVAIVVSRFNDFITGRLLEGAKDTLIRHEVEEEQIDVAYVPGAFEIPLVAKKLARKGDYDAVITLGCVIRGLLLIMITFVMKLQKVFLRQMKYQRYQLFLVF